MSRPEIRIWSEAMCDLSRVLPWWAEMMASPAYAGSPQGRGNTFDRAVRSFWNTDTIRQKGAWRCCASSATRQLPTFPTSQDYRECAPPLGAVDRAKDERYNSRPISSSIEGANVDAQERIKQQVTGNPVVLYMKGTPQFPQCGFSANAVQILKACGVTDLLTVNVLEEPEIRQGIKQYANWPTIPQLYVKGEFVGGSDIMREMFQSGELQKLLQA